MSRFLPPRRPAFDFAAEWCVVAVAAALDIIWADHIGFRLLWDGWDSLIILGCAILVLAVKALAPPRAGQLAEYVALSLAGTMTLLVFSYLCLASARGPLFDPQLLAADRALGFDWLRLYHRLMQRPRLAHLLQLIYQSLLVQGLYCTLLLGLMGERALMKELWRLTFTTSVLCCLTAMLFPALGPYKIFGLDRLGAFLPDMERLLSHRNLVFSLGSLTGVVCFPSLHTAMALAYPYALRRTGAIFYAALAINLLMLASIPFFGGHYLTDMIAGAGVMLLSLGLVRLLARLDAKRVKTFALHRPLAGAL